MKRFADKAWRLIRWEKGKPQKAIDAWPKKLRCAAGPGHRKKAKERWREAQREFLKHRKRKLRQRRERLALTPYVCGSHGRFALPCAVVECESEYNIRARNGESTAGGYGQAIDSTWVAYGGRDRGGSHPAAEAPKAEQDRVFAAIWAGGSGASHWAASQHCWG